MKTILSVFLALFVPLSLGATDTLSGKTDDFGDALIEGTVENVTIPPSTVVDGHQAFARYADDSVVAFSACGGHATDAFVVEQVALSPNPPVKNGNLKISVTGELKETVEKNAKLRASIMVGGVQVTHLDFDYCEGINGPGCPTKPGTISFSLVQWLDKHIPTMFKYSVRVEFITNDNRVLGCAVIKTKIHKSGRNS